jgi:hypothetical protein
MRLFFACALAFAGCANVDSTSPPSTENTDPGGDASPPPGASDGGDEASPAPARDASRDRNAPSGDDSGPVLGDDDDASPAGCQVVSDISFKTTGSFLYTTNGVEYRELYAEIPSLSGFLSGSIRLTLYRSAPGGFAPGTLSLACAPGTPCARGLLYDAVTGGKNFGPSQGTITVATVLSPQSNEMTGTLQNLEFRALKEVQVDGGPDAGITYYDEIDPNGACITVPNMTFDTRSPDGTPCVNENECGTTKVCSVTSMTCAEPECTSPTQCGSGQKCQMRSSAPDFSGYCVMECGPFTPCGSGYDCESGACKHAGTATLGATCIPYRDVETGCQAGLYCLEDNSGITSTATCVQGCNALAAAPGCSSADRCLAGYCGAPLPSSEVATGGIDQTCTLPSPQPGMPQVPTAPCADDGVAYRGLCATEMSWLPGGGVGPSQTMCRRACDPKGPACPTGRSCQFTAAAGWGVAYVCR